MGLSNQLRSDSIIDFLKARLVAQGFTHVPGFDFTFTFNPIVKATIIRTVLAIVVMSKWTLHQLGIKNAFLNRVLKEVVFMEQPPGYVNAHFFNHAPSAWFQRFSDFLSGLGFTCSHIDSSLFIYCRGSILRYLLVYFDDIIVTDLRKLSYFLGLEVTYTNNGLFFSQQKYVHDILLRAQLHENKPMTTPMFMHNPVTAHFHVVKRIIHYVCPDTCCSSCEPEYRTLANATTDTCTFLYPQTPTILSDNKSAIFISRNLVTHKPDKHIELDSHFVREMVQNGPFVTFYIFANLNVVDVLTKSLSRSLYQSLRSKICVSTHPTSS
ncbi:hypothetical protein OSB04_016694 [Centaurea solstitialis]|uniref:Reverse transcriptase Ty1/copia-type domain-containing protein n=1 Tax=Centaurea solstitialis TaxID=347529 RepID=A0AA38WJZ5_9ASTR|nr:hypothetical protein OSB04_016694 [Centaurea solstitialis]